MFQVIVSSVNTISCHSLQFCKIFGNKKRRDYNKQENNGQMVNVSQHTHTCALSFSVINTHTHTEAIISQTLLYDTNLKHHFSLSHHPRLLLHLLHLAESCWHVWELSAARCPPPPPWRPPPPVVGGRRGPGRGRCPARWRSCCRPWPTRATSGDSCWPCRCPAHLSRCDLDPVRTCTGRSLGPGSCPWWAALQVFGRTRRLEMDRRRWAV